MCYTDSNTRRSYTIGHFDHLGLCGQSENYTAYTSNGISFFNNDNTVPADVQTFINNGRVLFGSSGVSSSDTSTVSTNTATETSSTTSATDNATSGIAASGVSGSTQSNNQIASMSGPIAESDLNLDYLLLCKKQKNCKQLRKSDTKGETRLEKPKKKKKETNEKNEKKEKKGKK